MLGAMMAAPEEASEAEVLSNMASKARPGFTTVDEEHADHLSVLYACAARGAAQELRHVLVTFERRGWDVNVGGKPSSRAARTLRRRTYCRPVLRPSTSLIIASLTGAAECVSALLDFDGIDPNAWCRVSLPLFGIYVGAGGCCALLAACRAGRVAGSPCHARRVELSRAAGRIGSGIRHRWTHQLALRPGDATRGLGRNRCGDGRRYGAYQLWCGVLACGGGRSARSMGRSARGIRPGAGPDRLQPG